MAELFLERYVQRKKKQKPRRIVLDLDGTDDPTYGDQQLTFFHGDYDQYMYHSLVIYNAAKAKIIIRGDAGLAVPAFYEYCEQEKPGYVIGLIRNDVLAEMSSELLSTAHDRYEQTG